MTTQSRGLWLWALSGSHAGVFCLFGSAALLLPPHQSDFKYESQLYIESTRPSLAALLHIHSPALRLLLLLHALLFVCFCALVDFHYGFVQL